MTERVKIDGASEISGVPVGTLRFYRATNQGPRSYTVAGRLWYDVADLEAWLDEQKAQSVRGGVAEQQLARAVGVVNGTENGYWQRHQAENAPVRPGGVA